LAHVDSLGAELRISPNKKYIVYLINSGNILVLHLINISDLQNPIDTIIDSNVTPGYRFENYWEPDSSGFYYEKDKFINGQSLRTFYYFSLSNNKTTELNKGFPGYIGNGQEFISFYPDEKYYVVESWDGLELYDSKGNHIKTLYRPDFSLSWNKLTSNIYYSENTTYIARQTIDNSLNSTSFIEKIDTKGKSTTQIERKGESNAYATGIYNSKYTDLKISPDSNYLSAFYTDEIGLPTTDNESYIFIYNLKTGQKVYVARQDYWNDDYYWISPNEIITTYGYLTNSMPQAFLIDIKGGSVKEYSPLKGEEVITLF
jgi:hypothetical protein